MVRYETWTKEALIAHIKALEARAKPGASSLAGKLARTNLNSVESSSSRESKEMDFSKYPKRFVAIKFAYLGWNYHGLAFQKDQVNSHKTVEGEILKALHKTRCIEEVDALQCNFSRCGRTDADVSALSQVIALNLRSNIPVDQQAIADNDVKELDYLRILNSCLPDDILAYEICLRPPEDFDARFSCRARHYKYFFWKGDLDLDAMTDAAKRLIGPDKDFRNFCKIDPSKQITNYKRTILESDIVAAPGTSGMYYFNLRGTAFLWNQVRSIMAILFLVGQRLETPDIIDKMLDVETLPRRPVYEIAWGVPLVLANCEYPDGMEWIPSAQTRPDKIFNVWHEYLQKMNMASAMLHTVEPFAQSLDSEGTVTGRGAPRRGKYTPLLNRPRTETPEAINAKWLVKQHNEEKHLE